MKKVILLCLCLLAAVLPLAGQNNAYGIDDTCYRYFQQTENLLTRRDISDRDAYDRALDSLYRAATEKGDDKALTIYYVQRMKRATHTPDLPDAEIDAAREQLCAKAKELGYKQYYYYAYELSQSYYYNRGSAVKAMELLLELQDKALAEQDDYGLWTSARYLSQLYIAMNDYQSAKRYLNRSVEVFSQTEDPTLLRQSTARQYLDLSDCYPLHSDSVRVCIMDGVAHARSAADTLRCEYYLAKLAAIDRDEKEFRRHRDFCLANSSFGEASHPGGRAFLEAIGSLMHGDPDQHIEAFDAISRHPERKYAADLADEFGFHDISSRLHHRMVQQLENSISSTNAMRLAELNARMGNLSLSADLAKSSQTVAFVSRLALILALLFLLIALLFSWLTIRNLRRHRVADEAHIAELQAANDRVRLADAAKTRFLQNMSHEIRTPLNAIMGFSQLLALPDGSFPEEEKAEFGNHIINNSNMLTMLLNDILSASQVDAGTYEIIIGDCDVHAACQAAMSSAEHRLLPGVRMYYAPETDAPLHFRTDPRRVQQILINFLTNACKYTEKGEIRLASSLTENPGQMTFSVTDTGPGVPDDQGDKIFDRFTNLNEFTQGTGLGLSICRDIATQMGGRVFLDTAYKAGGARFVFTLPLEPPQEKQSKS